MRSDRRWFQELVGNSSSGVTFHLIFNPILMSLTDDDTTWWCFQTQKKNVRECNENQKIH